MEKVTIPDVLKPFSAHLLELQKPYISIKAKPLNYPLDKDPLDPKQSKFLGKPFIPEDMQYPMDKQGDPMVMIAQINFSEIPPLEGFPTEGILQLYFSSTEWWGNSGEEKIIYLDSNDLQKTAKTDLPTFSTECYEELPIWKIHQLTFVQAMDTGSSEDSQCAFDFNGLGYWDFEETLSEKDQEIFNEYFTSEGHKISGYAYFTQGDPRDYEKEKIDDIHLLQIDSDDEIMFGDSGIGHIFISPENLKNKNFDKAYFYWDCC